MKYIGYCKRSYTKYGARYDTEYPIESVSRFESYILLPKGNLEVENDRFDDYFEIMEVE